MGHGSDHCSEHDHPPPCPHCLEDDVKSADAEISSLTARLAASEAALAGERERAEQLEADRNEWKGVADGRLIEIVDLHSINAAALARAEKAEYTAAQVPQLRTRIQQLAAAREDAVREFAEWLAAQHPVCQFVRLNRDGVPDDSSIVDVANIYLAVKEPTGQLPSAEAGGLEGVAMPTRNGQGKEGD